MAHDRYTIIISFDACEGLKDKVLDEIKEVRHFVEKALDHASDIKTVVTHEPVEKKGE
jgi:hypothetical protein